MQTLTDFALRDKYEKSFDAETKSTSLITEQISSMATIKATGSEQMMRERWENIFLEKNLKKR